MISPHVDDVARYLDSVEDFDIVNCFLDFQESNDLPRKIQYLVVD